MDIKTASFKKEEEECSLRQKANKHVKAKTSRESVNEAPMSLQEKIKLEQ